MNTTYLDVDDENIQDTLYKKELLEAFNISKYNHETISNTLKLLFQTYKTSSIGNILELTIQSENKLPFKLDKETAFTMLFSFEHFYLFHKFLQEINSTASTSSTNSYDKMVEHLQKK